MCVFKKGRFDAGGKVVTGGEHDFVSRFDILKASTSSLFFVTRTTALLIGIAARVQRVNNQIIAPVDMSVGRFVDSCR